MRIFQRGFNYNEDGPGNRLVYHIQGCNMSCRWCCNPEGMDFNGGENIAIDDLIKEILSSKMMFFDGGGVTFTGGEVTCSFDELKTVLEILKKENIHTAIETNGTHKKLEELFGLIDFLIMDFKHYDSDKHLEYTDITNDEIKENFKKICSSKRQALIRIPLVYEFNFDAHGFGKFFSQFDTSNVKFEVLPYHEFGVHKWTSEYKIKNGTVTKEQFNDFCNILKSYNLNIER